MRAGGEYSDATTEAVGGREPSQGVGGTVGRPAHAQPDSTALQGPMDCVYPGDLDGHHGRTLGAGGAARAAAAVLVRG